MKKLIAVALSAVVCFGVLAGCGSSKKRTRQS